MEFSKTLQIRAAESSTNSEAKRHQADCFKILKPRPVDVNDDVKKKDPTITARVKLNGNIFIKLGNQHI